MSSSGTLNELRCSWYQKGDRCFSSFAYRVEAARLLGTIATLGDPNTEQIETAEMSLMGWFQHLPPRRRGVLGFGGQVDEMLFHAQVMIYGYVCTLLWHQGASLR